MLTDSPAHLHLHLQLRGPRSLGDCELYEAVDESHPDPEEHIYSCVALYRKNWRSGWPALGGTRWHPEARDAEQGKAGARREAVELASAMYMKNSLLRHADEHRRVTGAAKGSEGLELFGWQGGKGVIWTPYRPEVSKEENRRRFLTPRRLICHGLLLQHLGGEYIGSKDMGVGTAQLKWIETSTRFTIGNGCLADTGEATAAGVAEGLREAARELARRGELEIGGPEAPLRGLGVLVVGAGKVGLPLIRELHGESGAEVWVYDPELDPSQLELYYRQKRNQGAAVDERHAVALAELAQQGRILHGEGAEELALTLPGLRIVSPNGGRTGWLSDSLAPGGPSRAEVLARAAAQDGSLRLVLGAGNDQVPISDGARESREAALAALAGAGVWFLPDPLVSPGGVIAVSHELAPEWNREVVNQDTREIVALGVRQFFAAYEGRAGGGPPAGGLDSGALWEAFTALVEEEWG